MHIETQAKTNFHFNVSRRLLLTFSLIITTSCSFIELNPGAKHIILSNSKESCQKISVLKAKVKTETIWIERSPKAIADELQILAQNAAYKQHANAIWPSSEIENGQQNFDILRCDFL